MIVDGSDAELKALIGKHLVYDIDIANVVNILRMLDSESEEDYISYCILPCNTMDYYIIRIGSFPLDLNMPVLTKVCAAISAVKSIKFSIKRKASGALEHHLDIICNFK